MKISKLTLFSILLCVSVAVHAEINWTSEQGNAAHTGFVNITTDPAKYRQVWDIKLASDMKFNGHIYSSVYDKNRGYYVLEKTNRGCGGGIPPRPRCVPRALINSLDTRTGKTIWEKEIQAGEFLSSAQLKMAGNKLILIDTPLDRYPNFSAYNLDNGTKLFSSHSDGKVSYSEADNNQLYIAYLEYEQLGNINLETGQRNWRKDGKTKYEYLSGFAIANDYLVRIIGNNVVVNDRKSGDRLFDIKVGQDQIFDSNNILTVDPVNNTAYLMYKPSKTSWDYRTLYAYNLQNPGEIRWEMPMQQKWVTPVIADNEIYSVEYNEKDPVRLNAINPVTGKLNWTWQVANDVIDTSKCFVATADMIFILGHKNLYAVSRSTHQKVWQLAIVDGVLHEVRRIEISGNMLFIHSIRKYKESYSADYITAIALN